MGHFSYNAGLGNVGSYQVAGTPYVTGNVDASHAEQALQFTRITNWIKIYNPSGSGDPLKVAFSSNGLKSAFSNYFTMPANTTLSFDIKATQLFLTGGNAGVTVMAGMTSLDGELINNDSISPSGSNWSGSAAAHVG